MTTAPLPSPKSPHLFIPGFPLSASPPLPSLHPLLCASFPAPVCTASTVLSVLGPPMALCSPALLIGLPYCALPVAPTLSPWPLVSPPRVFQLAPFLGLPLPLPASRGPTAPPLPSPSLPLRVFQFTAPREVHGLALPLRSPRPIPCSAPFTAASLRSSGAPAATPPASLVSSSMSQPSRGIRYPCAPFPLLPSRLLSDFTALTGRQRSPSFPPSSAPSAGPSFPLQPELKPSRASRGPFVCLAGSSLPQSSARSVDVPLGMSTDSPGVPAPMFFAALPTGLSSHSRPLSLAGSFRSPSVALSA